MNLKFTDWVALFIGVLIGQSIFMVIGPKYMPDIYYDRCISKDFVQYLEKQQ